MNQFALELPTLLTASLTLSVSAIVAWLALRWLKNGDYKIHRIVWLAVLVNGMILTRFSIELPVLNKNTSENIAKLFPTSPTRPHGLFIDQANVKQHSPLQEISSNQSKPAQYPLVESTSSIKIPHSKLPDSEEFAAPSVGHTSASHLASWLTTIWLTGFVLTTVYWLVCYLRILAMTSRAKPVSARQFNQCDRLRRESGLRKPIMMLQHERLGPALVLTPHGYRIIVPEVMWRELDDSQRTAILRHEIEHLRRRDIVSGFFGFFIAAIHWFNPLAWLAASRMNLAAEWACDEAAVSDPTRSSTFARALLSISTSETCYLAGARGFGSSDLKARISRILKPNHRTSRIHRMAFTSLAVSIVFIGWLNFRLVEQPTYATNGVQVSSMDEISWKKNVGELTTKLVEDNALNARFVKLASSEAGNIAIANSLADIEGELQNEAAQNIVPEFFGTQVDEAFRQRVVLEAAEAAKDIQNLQNVLVEIKGQCSGDSDAGKLFRRFLDSPHAATVLYFSRLRESIRPGTSMVMEHAGRFLAPREDGKLIVRESAKAPLRQKLIRYQDADRQDQILRSELKLLADELIEKDELHRKLKSRLQSAAGSAFVLAMAFDGNEPLSQHVDEYLENIDELFQDEPEGLAINEAGREHLIYGMAEMDNLLNSLDRLRKPIREIVANIDSENGESEKMLKSFLETEYGLAILALQIDLDVAGVEQFGDKIRSEVLEQADSGWVIREDRQDEVSQFAREMLRATRRLRRELRTVENRTRDVSSEKLGGLLSTVESKLILLERVQSYIERKTYDVWPEWLERHFHDNNNSYQLRTESTAWLENLEREAREIQAELAKDDF